MGYYIDLKKINIKDFKKKLKDRDYFLPSQKILAEKMDERFNCIIAHNIKNLFELQETLKTKSKVKEFSKISRLPEDYLVVLRREVNSYHPQPRKIKDFPCLNKKIKEALNKKGIKTTVELYNRIVTKEERKKLKNELNISDEEVQLLTKLADVSRLRYVNQTFATLLVNSDYDMVKKIQKADYKKMYKHLMELNNQNSYFKGKIGLKDMEFFVKDSRFFPLEVKY